MNRISGKVLMNRNGVYGNKEGFREQIRGLLPMAAFFIIYVEWFSELEKRNGIPMREMHMVLDDLIPFCELFVIPYFMWFGYMIINTLFIYFTDRRTYYCLSTLLYIGMGTFLLISTFCPNYQNLRLSVMPRNNIFTDMVRYLWRIDTSTNVFPSIHVYNSLCIMTAVHHAHKLNMTEHRATRCRICSKKKFRAAIYVIGVLIILSTVMIKQHSCYDVLGGFLMMGALYYGVYVKGHTFEEMLRKMRRRRRPNVFYG